MRSKIFLKAQFWRVHLCKAIYSRASQTSVVWWEWATITKMTLSPLHEAVATGNVGSLCEHFRFETDGIACQ